MGVLLGILQCLAVYWFILYSGCSVWPFTGLLILDAGSVIMAVLLILDAVSVNNIRLALLPPGYWVRCLNYIIY